MKYSSIIQTYWVQLQGNFSASENLFHRYCCKQIAVKEFDQQIADQALMNLIQIGLVLYKNPRLRMAIVTKKKQEEEIEDGTSELKEEKAESDTLSFIFHRLSNMTKKISSVDWREHAIHKKAAIFKLFAGLAANIDPKDLQPFLRPILIPVRRVIEGKDVDSNGKFI